MHADVLRDMCNAFGSPTYDLATGVTPTDAYEDLLPLLTVQPVPDVDQTSSSGYSGHTSGISDESILNSSSVSVYSDLTEYQGSLEPDTVEERTDYYYYDYADAALEGLFFLFDDPEPTMHE